MKKNNEGKKVTDSMTKSAELIQPNDANHLGNVFGGKVLAMIDLSGAISAMRHCRKIVVTASVDRVDFKHPIKVGHFAIIKARLNAAFKTSVEVQVEIYSENPITGEQLHTCSALVTYVALNEKGRPATIPPLACTTPEEKERHKLAVERKKVRDKARRLNLGLHKD